MQQITVSGVLTYIVKMSQEDTADMQNSTGKINQSQPADSEHGPKIVDISLKTVPNPQLKENKEESDSENKIVTRSQTKTVTELRTIFSPKNKVKRKREEDSGDRVVNAIKRVNPSSHRLKVHRTVVNKIKGKARRLASSVNSVNNHSHALNHKKTGNSISAYLLPRSSGFNPNKSDSSCYETTDNESLYTSMNSSRDVSDCENDRESEDQMLQIIASKMKTMTDEQVTELINQGRKKSMQKPKQSQEEATESRVDSEAIMDTEDSNNPNPTVISAITIQEMFQQLKREIKEDIQKVHTEVQSYKNQVSAQITEQCKGDVMQHVNHEIQQHVTTIKELKQDVAHYKSKTSILTDVVNNMSLQMDELKSKMEGLELSNAKKSVSISGLYIYGTKYEQIQQVEKFLDEMLGVYVNIDDMYTLGSTQPRLIVVSFQSIQQKKDVLRFKSFLKGKTNKDNRPYFINEYIPTATQEKRNREKLIRQQIDKLQSPPEVAYIRGVMHIQGAIYKSKVLTPTPKDLVDMSAQELKQVLKLPIKSSGSITQERSIFAGYTAAVKNHQQIREMYKAMKILHPGARHIVCAYNIEGEEEPYFNQNYCDDDEPGAGKKVLDLMLKHDMLNRVVFVTRKYGGIKMGSDRFDCYAQAAKEVLQAHPFNEILQIQQPLKPPGSPKGVKYSFTPRNKSVRGAKQPSTQRSAADPTPTRRATRGGYDYRANRYQQRRYRGRGAYAQPPPYHNQRWDRESSHQDFRNDNDWQYGIKEDWQNAQDGQFYQDYHNERHNEVH